MGGNSLLFLRQLGLSVGWHDASLLVSESRLSLSLKGPEVSPSGPFTQPFHKRS